MKYFHDQVLVFKKGLVESVSVQGGWDTNTILGYHYLLWCWLAVESVASYTEDGGRQRLA